MTTIGTIAIIAIPSFLWLWTWSNNVELRRQRAKYRTQRDEAISKTCEMGGLIYEFDKRMENYRSATEEITTLAARLAKFETYKSLPRDEHGRFMKKGADPQIGQVSKG